MIRFFFSVENRNFLRLWLAQVISQFGDRIHQLALIGLMAERFPGSAVELAKLMSFTIFPVFLIQPVAGIFVDRWDRRTTLFVCDIIRFVLVLFIPFAFFYKQSMIPIYLIVFLVFSFSRFYVPAKMSILPDLVDKENLLMANSLVTTTGMIAFVLGCALGGFIIEHYGARMGFIIDSFTFLISSIFVFSIRQPFRVSRAKIIKTGREVVLTIKKTLWDEFKEGLLYLIKKKEIRFILSMFFLLLSAAGAVYVVIIVFIQQAFGSVTKDLGILAVCLGIGLFSGALLYGRWGQKLKWYNTIFACLFVGGIMLIVFAHFVYHYHHIRMTMFLAGLLGLIIGPIFIASNTTIQFVSEESMRGKVFSALEITIHLAFLLSMLVSSWLSERMGRVWILMGVGILFSFFAVFGFIMSRCKGGLAFK